MAEWSGSSHPSCTGKPSNRARNVQPNLPGIFTPYWIRIYLGNCLTVLAGPNRCPLRNGDGRMSNLKRLATVVLGIGLLATLTACKGDPNVKKQKYLESGNRYAEKQQFKEAVIQYQNAIQVDPGFEPAHYKLSQ